MDPSVREALEALKETADGLMTANQGIKRAADAMLHARHEHDDLRETVRRLEGLVEDLLRQQRDNNGHST